MTDYKMVPVALLPCPFCGEAGAFDSDDSGYHWIFCTGCGMATPGLVHTEWCCESALAEQWNRRAAPPQDNWLPIESAPRGLPSADVGCRDASKWFIGLRKDGVEMEIQRRAWPHEDGWRDHQDTTYTSDWFTHWKPKSPKPPEIIPGTTEALDQLSIRK